MRSTTGWLALTVPLLMMGCAHSAGTDCAWARPILISKADVLTLETAKAILAHNLKVTELCRPGE
ncbi:MAG: hypothetical protein FJY55_12985 [Betaproteobacteria bacterium]|nr:hypothetical protein [Betaproteobacteria bacterium]